MTTTAKKGGYVQYPGTMETGDRAQAGRFAKTVVGLEWVPTVVNPSMEQGLMEYIKFYWHLFVWVVSIVLGGVTNFMAKEAMKSDDGCTGASCYQGITETTYIISISSGVASIVGVLLLLGGAAWLSAEEYRETAWLNALITLCTVYGCVGSYYIFSFYAVFTDTVWFGLSLGTVIFQSYAQVLLYATSSKLDVLMLPRAFLPSIGASIQFISAVAITSNDFKSGTFTDTTETTYAEFTYAQKTIAWLVPAFTFGALVIMVILRKLTRTDEGGDIGSFPFLRSFVLAPFTAAGILSVYKLGFMTVDNDHQTAYIFSLLGALFNVMIIAVVFVPGADAFGTAKGAERFIK